MKVWFKRGLFSLVVVFIVALVGAAIFLLTFDPNAYKNKIEEIVYERYQRTLTIDGDIELSLFPRIGLSVDSVSLSDRLSDDPFASIESVRFAVAIWPLMSNQFVVDHVALRGVRAWIVREEDGSFNFTDLLERSVGRVEPVQSATALSRLNPFGTARAQASTALDVVDQAASSAGAALKSVVAPDAQNTDFQIDIAGLDFKEGQIHYYDKVNATIARIVDLEINTGRMTFGQAFDVAFTGSLQGDYPIMDAQLNGQAMVKLDPYNNSYAAQRLNVQLEGDLGRYSANSLQLRGNVAYQPSTRLLQARSLDLQTQGEWQGEQAISDLQFSISTPQLNYGRDQDTLDFQQLALRGTGMMGNQALDVALDAPEMVLTADEASAQPIVGSLKLGEDNAIGVNLRIDGIGGSMGTLHAQDFALDAVMQRPYQAWQLNATSPLAWDRESHALQWHDVDGKLSLKDEGLPASPAEAGLQGKVVWHLRQRQWEGDIQAGDGHEQLQLDGHYQYAERPTLNLNVLASEFDIGTWLPSTEARAERQRNQRDEASVQPELVGPVAGPVIDFSSLANVDATIKAHFEKVRVGDFRLDDFRSDLSLAKGDLQIKLQSPAFYEGQLNGNVRVTHDNTLRTSINGYGIELGQLLQDSFGQRRASGKSDISLRLNTQGYTPAAWLSGLQGSFNLDATNGQIYGINLEEALRSILHVAENAYSPELPELSALTFDPQQSTDFSALSLQSIIQDGTLAFSTLVASTPRLRVSTVKPALIRFLDQQVDLTLQMRLQKVSSVVRDPSIAELIGVTVPIRVHGDVAEPQHQVEWEGINSPTIKEALENGLLDKLATQSTLSEQIVAADTKTATADIRDRSLGEAIRDLLGIVAR